MNFIALFERNLGEKLQKVDNYIYLCTSQLKKKNDATLIIFDA
jgi:hypothetical protein